VTHKEIKQWLDAHLIENYTIGSDGVVDVAGDVILDRFDQILAIPVQFGNVSGEFNCNNTKITSLKGAPHHVDGNFRCSFTKVESLEYAPHYVGGYFSCYTTQVKSLSGVDKIVKHVGSDFICDDGVTHALGLLLIEGIVKINIDGTDGKVNAIMNKYLGTGDILSAQDELIDAGFIDQARL